MAARQAQNRCVLFIKERLSLVAALRKRSRGCGRMFLAAGSGEAAPGCCSRDMGWARSGGYPLEEGPLGRDSLGMLGWTSQSGSPQRCGVTERGAWNVSKVYGSWLDPVLALLRSGGSSTHIPAATAARESPAPPSQAQALPLLHFPHPDLGVSFQTPVLERNPSAFPRDQRFPRPSLPGVPAFPTPPCLCLFCPGPFQVFICL